jgi:hypothetical protein
MAHIFKAAVKEHGIDVMDTYSSQELMADYNIDIVFEGDDQVIVRYSRRADEESYENKRFLCNVEELRDKYDGSVYAVKHYSATGSVEEMVGVFVELYKMLDGC